MQDSENIVDYLIQENAKLREKLKRFDIESYPLTYKGCVEYIKTCLDFCGLNASADSIASQLNKLGFPTYTGKDKWTKDKIKRLQAKIRQETKPKLKIIDVSYVCVDD
jgi:hypothetical protein